MAYSQSIAIAAVSFAGSMNDAALAAVEQCQTQSGASDCAALGWFYQGYGALARGSGTSWGFGWSANAQYADAYAMQYCQQYGGGSSCQVMAPGTDPGCSR
ncbi:MAG: DUF4189 domain-containing protein [Pseudonocardiaceae bacterium]